MLSDPLPNRLPNRRCTMNLYLLTQDVNDDWDTYQGAVVAAESEDEARNIHPSGNLDEKAWNPRRQDWCRREQVQVEYIGVAKEGTERGVILTDYKSG